MATTVATANAQNLPVPEYDPPRLEEFFRFALSLDGYGVAEELGENAFSILERLRQTYLASGTWQGSLLELRIALFCQARSLHHSGCGADEDETVRENTRLLDAIRRASNDASPSS